MSLLQDNDCGDKTHRAGGRGAACCLLSQPRRVYSLSPLLHTRGISRVSLQVSGGKRAPAPLNHGVGVLLTGVSFRAKSRSTETHSSSRPTL